MTQLTHAKIQYEQDYNEIEFLNKRIDEFAKQIMDLENIIARQQAIILGCAECYEYWRNERGIV